MKRTIPFSLLLLIAGNGLMVTQTHAGFLDILKNLDSQDKKTLAIVCFYGGLASLFLTGIKANHLSHAIRALNVQRSVVNDATQAASTKMDYLTIIARNKEDIIYDSITIAKLVALGTSLAALCVHLLNKA